MAYLLHGLQLLKRWGLLSAYDSRTNLTELGAQYSASTEAGELYTIQPINTDGNADPIVINELRKSDLIKIYDRYFVPIEKPARKVYDSLLNSAKEKCPFCGGIGTPRNLDHFLPKVHFPQFSVFPKNLVPSCRDCNMEGKAKAFATNAQDQFLQPYGDNNKFFFSQWIYASYHMGIVGEPGEFEYYINPPEDWDEVDKLRVAKHFNAFDLAKRYATKAAEHLGTVLTQIETMENNGFDFTTIRIVLLNPGVDAAPFVNHWQKGMYQALIQALADNL